MHKLYCHHPPRPSSSHEPQIDARGRSGGKDFQVQEGTPQQQLQHHACSTLLLVWLGAHHATSRVSGLATCCVQSRAGSPLPYKHCCCIMYKTLMSLDEPRAQPFLRQSAHSKAMQLYLFLPPPPHQSWTPRKNAMRVRALCPASWADPLLLVENLSNNPRLHFQFGDYCISTPETQTQLVITQWSVP